MIGHHDAIGTGRTAFAKAAYSAGGKTGTAQVYTVGQNEKYNAKTVAENLRDHAWFVAFAPAEAATHRHRGAGRECRLRLRHRRAHRARKCWMPTCWAMTASSNRNSSPPRQARAVLEAAPPAAPDARTASVTQ